jgi:hypothetical protein
MTADGQNAVYVRNSFQSANGLQRVCEFVKGAVKRDLQKGRGMCQYAQSGNVHAVILDEAGYQSIHLEIGQLSGGTAELAKFVVTGQLHGSIFAQHYAQRNFDGSGNIVHEFHVGCQAAMLQFANHLQAVRSACLCFNGVVKASHNHL